MLATSLFEKASACLKSPLGKKLLVSATRNAATNLDDLLAVMVF